jgi:hypothetical protein
MSYLQLLSSLTFVSDLILSLKYVNLSHCFHGRRKPYTSSQAAGCMQPMPFLQGELRPSIKVPPAQEAPEVTYKHDIAGAV